MAAARKSRWNPAPQLATVDLAAIRARYVEGKERLPAHVYADMDAMWNELDRLRFELAGAHERTKIAREERDDIQGRYWRLQMTAVKGGPV
jgi:hypothetical protein